MPVDPNEPTYCLCNQVSYGEMIGCDNPDVSKVTFNLRITRKALKMGKRNGKLLREVCLNIIKAVAKLEENFRRVKTNNFPTGR